MIVIPTGTLTKKIHCQPKYSVSTPPRSTPTAAPLPATAPQMPNALFRSAPPCRKAALMIESVAGETIAPPSPCSARNAISHAPLCAKPHISEPNVNSAIPAMKTFRRPSTSAARPPRRRKPPNASEYAVMIHWSVDCESSRSTAIEGSATLTIETSSTTMKNAAQTSTRAFQRRGSGVNAASTGAEATTVRPPGRDPPLGPALDPDRFDAVRRAI